MTALVPPSGQALAVDSRVWVRPIQGIQIATSIGALFLAFFWIVAVVVVIATTKIIAYGGETERLSAEEDLMAIIDIKTEITGDIWEIEAQPKARAGSRFPRMALFAEKSETVTEGTVGARIEA